MTDYKATPEQWETIAEYAKDLNSGPACLLELRARVEALEARRPASKVYEINEPLKLTPRQQEEIAALLRPNSKPSPNSSQIGRPLVERVAIAISQCEDSSCWDDEAVNWTPEARAAIREVAAWLHAARIWEAADLLEQEAEQ